jgi:hypothetical protein
VNQAARGVKSDDIGCHDSIAIEFHKPSLLQLLSELPCFIFLPNADVKIKAFRYPSWYLVESIQSCHSMLKLFVIHILMDPSVIPHHVENLDHSFTMRHLITLSDQA